MTQETPISLRAVQTTVTQAIAAGIEPLQDEIAKHGETIEAMDHALRGDPAKSDDTGMKGTQIEHGTRIETLEGTEKGRSKLVMVAVIAAITTVVGGIAVFVLKSIGIG